MAVFSSFSLLLSSFLYRTGLFCPFLAFSQLASHAYYCTVASYCVALVELLLLVFEVNVTSAPFHKRSRALFRLQSAHALPEPAFFFGPGYFFLFFSLVYCGLFGLGLFLEGFVYSFLGFQSLVCLLHALLWHQRFFFLWSWGLYCTLAACAFFSCPE